MPKVAKEMSALSVRLLEQPGFHFVGGVRRSEMTLFQLAKIALVELYKEAVAVYGTNTDAQIESFASHDP